MFSNLYLFLIVPFEERMMIGYLKGEEFFVFLDFFKLYEGMRGWDLYAFIWQTKASFLRTKLNSRVQK